MPLGHVVVWNLLRQSAIGGATGWVAFGFRAMKADPQADAAPEQLQRAAAAAADAARAPVFAVWHFHEITRFE